jgi:hypothetical protein
VAGHHSSTGPARADALPQPARTTAPHAPRRQSLDPFADQGPNVRWHIRERRRVAWAKGRDAGAPAAVGLESWFYGCTSRTVITSSSHPAMVGWEIGGMPPPTATAAIDYVGYLYDPVADVIYVGDLGYKVHWPWHTCGLGLAGYSQVVPGGVAYLARHGEPLTAPPDPALVDPRLAHPTASMREESAATMDRIYLRAFHLAPPALGP